MKNKIVYLSGMIIALIAIFLFINVDFSKAQGRITGYASKTGGLSGDLEDVFDFHYQGSLQYIICEYESDKPADMIGNEAFLQSTTSTTSLFSSGSCNSWKQGGVSSNNQLCAEISNNQITFFIANPPSVSCPQTATVSITYDSTESSGGGGVPGTGGNIEGTSCTPGAERQCGSNGIRYRCGFTVGQGNVWKRDGTCETEPTTPAPACTSPQQDTGGTIPEETGPLNFATGLIQTAIYAPLQGNLGQLAQACATSNAQVISYQLSQVEGFTDLSQFDIIK